MAAGAQAAIVVLPIFRKIAKCRKLTTPDSERWFGTQRDHLKKKPSEEAKRQMQGMVYPTRKINLMFVFETAGSPSAPRFDL